MLAKVLFIFNSEEHENIKYMNLVPVMVDMFI